MAKEIKKSYKVLNPISIGGRVERGSIINLTESEAKNIGDYYLEEVNVEERDNLEIPDEGTGEYDETEDEGDAGAEETEEDEAKEEEKDEKSEGGAEEGKEKDKKGGKEKDKKEKSKK